MRSVKVRLIDYRVWNTISSLIIMQIVTIMRSEVRIVSITNTRQ